MKNVSVQGSYIETQKKDAEEMIDLLKRIPNEEKEKVHGILIGFVLGSESRSVKSG
jgi:alpha-acetolactate decarboxylase